MELASMRELNMGLLLFATAVILCLLVGTTPFKSKRQQYHMRCFAGMLYALLVTMVSEAVSFLLDGNAECVMFLYVNTPLSIVTGLLVCVMYLYCLVSFVREENGSLRLLVRIFGAAYGALCLLVVCTAPTGWFFSYDAAGFYHDGPLYFLVKGMYFFANLLVVIIVFCYRNQLPLNGTLNLLSFSVFPMVAVVLAPYWYPTPVCVAATLSCVLLNHFFRGELLRQLSENRISGALSQMQPHFMFNVLNSIYYLCTQNPQQAQEAVEKFASYLRCTLASVEQTAPIPFEQEYGHILSYLALEQMRFRGLKVVYDMGVTDFWVPPMTVQPLVENAVKHGVTKKHGCGTVTVSTWETEKNYCISVRDTGVGFNPDRYGADGKRHIGINNVRERLLHMSGGTLNITSELGKGTNAVVTIPKEKEKRR